MEAKARERQTPLHIASRLGNVDIAVLLLQHGADVRAMTADHYNPLHIAAKQHNHDVSKHFNVITNGVSATNFIMLMESIRKLLPNLLSARQICPVLHIEKSTNFVTDILGGRSVDRAQRSADGYDQKGIHSLAPRCKIRKSKGIQTETMGIENFLGYN